MHTHPHKHTAVSAVLSSPVVFELGQHDPRSFHANVGALQVEGEWVCELHTHHHLFIHFALIGYLKYTQSMCYINNFTNSAYEKKLLNSVW